MAASPRNTQDADLSPNSRWWRKEGLKDELCTITYYFDDPQGIVRQTRIALHRGNETQPLRYKYISYIHEGRWNTRDRYRTHNSEVGNYFLGPESVGLKRHGR